MLNFSAVKPRQFVTVDLIFFLDFGKIWFNIFHISFESCLPASKDE